MLADSKAAIAALGKAGRTGGIFGNEAADVLAKNAAEGVPLDTTNCEGSCQPDYEEAVVSRAMKWRRKVVTSIGRSWKKKIGGDVFRKPTLDLMEGTVKSSVVFSACEFLIGSAKRGVCVYNVFLFGPLGLHVLAIG